MDYGYKVPFVPYAIDSISKQLTLQHPETPLSLSQEAEGVPGGKALKMYQG